MAVSSITLQSGRKVYVQAKGLKISSGGKVLPPAMVVGGLSKGDRRRIRKALDRMGRRDLCRQTLPHVYGPAEVFVFKN